MLKINAMILGVSLLGSHALACVGDRSALICPGDIVYQGTGYSQGATVVSVNRATQTATVRSNASSSLSTEPAGALSVTQGCLGNGLCVSSLVYKDTSYSQGARIVAIHRGQDTVVVRSVASSSLSVESAVSLGLSSGCLGRVCTNDLIYKETSYSQGARVIAVNPNTNQVVVRSVASSSLTSENEDSLYLSQGCALRVCVGQRVYKGTSYSQGADVIAVHERNQSVVVRSVASSSMSVEDVRGLDSTDLPQPPRARPPRRRP